MGRPKRPVPALKRLQTIQKELQELLREEEIKNSNNNNNTNKEWNGEELEQQLIALDQKLKSHLLQQRVWKAQQEQAKLYFGTSRRYNIIVADPPWKYRTPSWRGGTQSHYSILSNTDLRKLPVLGLAAEDCVLLMWATWPKLEEAQALIRSWGFSYKTVFMVWVKQNTTSDRLAIGTGCYTAANSEPLLLATRGHIARYQQETNFVSVYVGRRSQHSEKPSAIMDMIFDRFGDLPRIELFSRHRRCGWDAWGNECVNETDRDSTETQLKAEQDRISALAHELVRHPFSTLACSLLAKQNRVHERGHIYAQTLQVYHDYPPPRTRNELSCTGNIHTKKRKKAQKSAQSIKKARFK